MAIQVLNAEHASTTELIEQIAKCSPSVRKELNNLGVSESDTQPVGKNLPSEREIKSDSAVDGVDTDLDISSIIDLNKQIKDVENEFAEGIHANAAALQKLNQSDVSSLIQSMESNFGQLYESAQKLNAIFQSPTPPSSKIPGLNQIAGTENQRKHIWNMMKYFKQFSGNADASNVDGGVDQPDISSASELAAQIGGSVGFLQLVALDVYASQLKKGCELILKAQKIASLAESIKEADPQSYDALKKIEQGLKVKAAAQMVAASRGLSITTGMLSSSINSTIPGLIEGLNAALPAIGMATSGITASFTLMLLGYHGKKHIDMKKQCDLTYEGLARIEEIYKPHALTALDMEQSTQGMPEHERQKLAFQRESMLQDYKLANALCRMNLSNLMKTSDTNIDVMKQDMYTLVVSSSGVIIPTIAGISAATGGAVIAPLAVVAGVAAYKTYNKNVRDQKISKETEQYLTEQGLGDDKETLMNELYIRVLMEQSTNARLPDDQANMPDPNNLRVDSYSVKTRHRSFLTSYDRRKKPNQAEMTISGPYNVSSKVVKPFSDVILPILGYDSPEAFLHAMNAQTPLSSAKKATGEPAISTITEQNMRLYEQANKIRKSSNVMGASDDRFRHYNADNIDMIAFSDFMHKQNTLEGESVHKEYSKKTKHKVIGTLDAKMHNYSAFVGMVENRKNEMECALDDLYQKLQSLHYRTDVSKEEVDLFERRLMQLYKKGIAEHIFGFDNFEGSPNAHLRDWISKRTNYENHLQENGYQLKDKSYARKLEKSGKKLVALCNKEREALISLEKDLKSLQSYYDNNLSKPTPKQSTNVKMSP